MISLSPSINNSEEGSKRISLLSSSSFGLRGVGEEEEEEVEGIAGG